MNSAKRRIAVWMIWCAALMAGCGSSTERPAARERQDESTDVEVEEAGAPAEADAGSMAEAEAEPRQGALGACYGSGGLCNGVVAYEACLQDACDAEYRACLGEGYRSGAMTGPCAQSVRCAQACACDDACLAACADQQDASCGECIRGLLHSCVARSGCAQPVCD